MTSPPPSSGTPPKESLQGDPGVSRSGGTLSVPPRTAIVTMGEQQARLLRVALVVSVAAHVAVFGAWIAWPESNTPRVDLDEAIIKTRLVKLGKPRDEKLLPRLPTAPPPPPTESKPQPVVEPPKTPDTLPNPNPTPTPSAADILNKLKSESEKPRDLSNLIKDRLGEPTDEGRPDGDAEGAALVGEVTASYFARVQARIQNSMEVSSVLTDEEQVRLRAVLCIKIAEDGTVTNVNVKSSGSQIYDADVTAAARRASPVPAPPLPARRQAGEGVCFNACPKSCR